MKNFILKLTTLLFTTTFIFGCQKKDLLFSGTATIRGHVYIKEGTDSSISTLLKNQKVYLSQDTTVTSSYNYTVNTDSNGFFKIEFLKADSYLFYSTYTKNNLKYEGKTIVRVKDGNQIIDINLTLRPVPDNTITLNFADSAGSGSIGKIPFRLYTNRKLAIVDSIQRAFRDDIANENGNFIYNNIYPGKYYVSSKTFFANYTAVIFDSLTITSTDKLPPKEIKVALRAPVTPQNKIVLTFKDSANNQTVANLPFRLYTNRTAAKEDFVQYASNNGTTNYNGISIFDNLLPSKYYVVSQFDFSPNYKAVVFDSITVGLSGLFSTNIRVALRPSQINNKLTVNIVDINGGSVGNFPFWLYTSSVAAYSNDTIHSFLKSYTDNNGSYSILNINPNEYFIVARDSFAGLYLSAVDSIIVTTQNLHSLTLTIQP